MLRNRIIRAAIPKGSPIGFVDATDGTGAYGSTGTITVSSTDFMLVFSHGKIADPLSYYSYGGTSSGSVDTDFIYQQDTVGDSGNDYLNIASTLTVSSSGTLNMTENGGRAAGYGIIALDGGDNVSHSVGQSGSISVSSVTTDDVIVIYETTQTLGSTAYTPATPSGYTSAFNHSYQVGRGGGTQNWACRVSYKTGQSGTVSHTIPSGSWDYIGSAIIRVYNS